MPDIKEFLTGFLGKTLNIPAEKVASLFNDDGTVKDTALNEVLVLDATRVESFNLEKKAEFDNGFKKAQREVLQLREKELKDKYEITSNKQGLDLIDEIVTIKASKAVEMEPDKVKLHPEFIKMQDDLTKQLKETDKTWKDKYETRDQEIIREKTFSVISKKADSILAGFGLPEDVKLAENQKRLLLLELEKYNFTPDSSGEDYRITDKDGKILADAHGHPINFENIVSSIASNYWPKKEGVNRTSAQGKNNEAGKGNQGKTNIWKGKIIDDASFQAAMSTAKTAEERIEIGAALEEFEASKG